MLLGIRFGIALSVFLWAWPGFSAGQKPSVTEVVGKVQAQYEVHGDFKASFVQENEIKSLGKTQHSEGVVYFKKPGKMRWNYRKPAKKEIISDGKTLWTYQPDDRQVVISKLAGAFQSRVPSTFLAGIGNLKEDFEARFSEGTSSPAPREYVLELTPREAQGGLEKLTLAVDRETFWIRQARVQDAMGNITRITFSKIQFDNALKDSLFTFIPPKGVEVFHLPLSSPSGEPGR